MKKKTLLISFYSLDLNSYSLINYWPIKNSSINDFAGSANMTYGPNVALTSDRFNNPNSALDFQSGYNSIPSGVYFNGDFTVSVWINYNQNAQWARVLEISNSQADVVTMHASWSSTGFPGISITIAPGNFRDTSSSPALQTGRWYHVVYGLCGATARIYVDGQLKVTGGQLRPTNVNRTTNFIGGNSYGQANLNAKLDELRIYNRCMSQSEIMNLFNYVNA